MRGITMSEKDMFIQSWEREFQTTLKVLRAFPKDKMDLKPADKLRSARDLVWVFHGEQDLVEMAVKGQVDFSRPSTPPPTSMDEIITAYESAVKRNIEQVKGMSEADYNSMMGWFVAPKTPGKVRRADVLW